MDASSLPSRHEPIERRASDAVALSQLLSIASRIGELCLESGEQVAAQLRFGPELDTRRFSTGDTFSGALLDEITLELSDGGEHVEQEAARRATGIDGLIEDDEIHLLGRDFRCDLREIENRTGQTVEPGHHELVAFADESQGVGKSLALGAARTGTLLLEQLLAAVMNEFVALDFQALPDGRDARISDFHVCLSYEFGGHSKIECNSWRL